MEPPAARRRCHDAEDHISGLPDELLLIILLHLQSVAASARTSVLSRRWRRVWSYLPELDLGGSPAPTTTSLARLDSVDGAIKSYSAPTLHRLKIDVSEIDGCDDVPAHRVASWLGFASQRVTGGVYIRLPWPLKLSATQERRSTEEQLALPACERATEIDITMGRMYSVLRLPPAGSFTALTDLAVAGIDMDGGELGRVVSTQCPRLRNLRIRCIRLVGNQDVSIRSESLECLEFPAAHRGQLEVTAPMLLEISVARVARAYIAAPKLEKVEWTGRYDPGSHEFDVAPRHLRSLSIMYSTWISMLISSAWLVHRFDTVGELSVSLGIDKEIEGYMAFLEDMDKLPACETLIIHLFMKNHAFAPIMLHLLRRCSCIKKLKLFFNWHIPPKMTPCTTSGCPCLLPESCTLNDITFYSLEVIGISFFTGSPEEEQFLKLLLSRCNMVTLKRVDLTVPSAPVSSKIMEIVEGIRGICCPKRKVQFNVLAREVPKPSSY
ncbi:unnamed protein product [Urochloa decumbens]|uniref:F-box domain-containing protein n=1 Tax=Urochloa decumbens TaxID=240449 RepID=A0ABC8VZ74_9POAL